MCWYLTEDERERVSEGRLAPHQPRRVDGLRRAVDVAPADPCGCHNTHTSAQHVYLYTVLTHTTQHCFILSYCCQAVTEETTFDKF